MFAQVKRVGMRKSSSCKEFLQVTAALLILIKRCSGGMPSYSAHSEIPHEIINTCTLTTAMKTVPLGISLSVNGA